MNLIRSMMISKLMLLMSVNAQVESLVSEESKRVSPVVRAVDSVIHSVVSLGTEVHEMQLDENGEIIPVLVPEILNNGSGVIIDSSGLILTAYHVVSGFDSILLSLKGGRLHRAEIVQFDIKSDLALLRITDLQPGETLRSVRFAYPGDLLLGESVIAVGSPYGLSHSVSLGILSAKNRIVTNDGQITQEELLQSDIAINPGNSGGPLINADGELIGINIARRSEGESISFSIPVSRIEDHLKKWMDPRNFSGAKLGFTLKSEFKPVTGARLLIDKVSEVHEDVLSSGEEFVSVNDEPVDSLIDFYRLVHAMVPGDKLVVVNSMHEVKSFRLPSITPEERFESGFGVQLREINESIAGALGLPYSEGYLVSDTTNIASRASGLDIKRGDYLLKLGNYVIQTEADLIKALRFFRKQGGFEYRALFLRVQEDETLTTTEVLLKYK